MSLKGLHNIMVSGAIVGSIYYGYKGLKEACKESIEQNDDLFTTTWKVGVYTGGAAFVGMYTGYLFVPLSPVLVPLGLYKLYKKREESDK
tara:strand:- start:89 stop:358 length:270 start_codon:yes stop_codon:yes gene_type:complete